MAAVTAAILEGVSEASFSKLLTPKPAKLGSEILSTGSKSVRGGFSSFAKKAKPAALVAGIGLNVGVNVAQNKKVSQLEIQLQDLQNQGLRR